MYEYSVDSFRPVQSSSEIAHSNKNALYCPKRAGIVDKTCAQESLHSIESVLNQFPSIEYIQATEIETWEQNS